MGKTVNAGKLRRQDAVGRGFKGSRQRLQRQEAEASTFGAGLVNQSPDDRSGPPARPKAINPPKVMQQLTRQFLHRAKGFILHLKSRTSRYPRSGSRLTSQ